MLSEQTWRPESVLRMLMWLFLGMAAGAMVVDQMFPGGQSTGGDDQFLRGVMGTLIFDGPILTVVALLVREHGMTWNAAFGFNRDLKRAAVFGLTVALVALPLIMGLLQLLSWVLESLHQTTVEQEIVKVVGQATSIPQQIVYGLMTIVCAPVAEELLFRGVLYPAVKDSGFPRAALWGTSILFAAIHVNLTAFVPLMVLALTLVWLYERTQNIVAPMVAHAVFNAANFALILYNGANG